MDKVNMVIDIIKDINIKDKLRLGLLISENNFTLLIYNKAKLHDYFDKLLREYDEEYKTMLVNFNIYKVITFTMAKVIEMNKTEQNRVTLFLFNNIKNQTNQMQYS